MPRKIHSTPSKHVETVRTELRRYYGHYGKVARSTGIPVSWIHQFAQGLYAEPGAGRLELLARAVGFEISYRRVNPLFEARQGEFNEEALRRKLHQRVYGSSP